MARFAAAIAFVVLGLAVLGPSRALAHRLDYATAKFVVDFTDYAYCGEGDCDAEARRCFRVAKRRVDCVVAQSEATRRPFCSSVVSVRLRNRSRRIYYGAYSCPRTLRPLTSERFVRAWRRVASRRFRAGIDWPARDERNRYGVPRYDTKRELYDPR